MRKISESPISQNIVLLLLGVCLLLALTNRAGELLYSKITLPLSFFSRQTFDLSPKIDPRVKVYSMDNHTVSLLQRDYLTMESWVQILQYFDQYNPKAIFVDKVFGLPLRSDLQKPFTGQYAKDIVASLGKIKSPVVVGSFFSDNPIEVDGTTICNQ